MQLGQWLSWRLLLGSAFLGTVLAVLLVNSRELSFSLSGLDLFFAVTTVISLGFNLWQLFRDRYKYVPLRNSLIGLFNDIKARQLRVHERSLLITSQAGMSQDVRGVRMQFYDFVEETIQSHEQIKEHVVAAVHTLDPSISTQQIFKAAEFGLSPKELAFRAERMERLMEKQRTQSALGSPPGDNQ